MDGTSQFLWHILSPKPDIPCLANENKPVLNKQMMLIVISSCEHQEKTDWQQALMTCSCTQKRNNRNHVLYQPKIPEDFQ